MGYACIKNFNKECSGCGCCQPDVDCTCPECGKEAEKIYTSNVNGEILGCDNCITENGAYEVLYEKD